VEERPHEARHPYRVILTYVAGVLLLDQRIDQHLERSLGLGNKVIVFRGRLDESAEHHPIMRWMRHRELNVCLAHGLKADAATPVPFPGIGGGLPERTEPFFPYRRQQGLLVGKMAVERAPGDAQVLAHGPKRQLLDSMCLDRVQRLIEKRAAQVAMVIGLDGLLSRSRVCRTSHTKILTVSVDIVNMEGYIDVDAVHIAMRECHMFPFIVLVIATLLLRGIGAAGVALFNNWIWCLRGGLALMFLVTASAHWGKRRADLIAMVPRAFRRPDLMVSAKGVLEILGAAGLLIPAIAPMAAAGLAALLISLFPANIRAAREGLTIGGRPATALPLRTLLQLVFLASVLAAGFPGIFPLGVR
jgi:uncharacterized membrane protein